MARYQGPQLGGGMVFKTLKAANACAAKPLNFRDFSSTIYDEPL
jgi:hypothetical protein